MTNLKDTIGTGTAATVWDVLEALEGVEKGCHFHGFFWAFSSRKASSRQILVPFGPTFGSWTWQSACTSMYYVILSLPPAHPCFLHHAHWHISRPWHSDGESGCPFSWYLWSGRGQLKLLEAHISLALLSWLRLMFYSMQQIYSTCPTVSCCWILIACDFNRCWILVEHPCNATSLHSFPGSGKHTGG